jgi:hypothetical protein
LHSISSKVDRYPLSAFPLLSPPSSLLLSFSPYLPSSRPTIIVVGTHIDTMTPEELANSAFALQEAKRIWKNVFPRTKVFASFVSCTTGTRMDELSEMLIEVCGRREERREEEGGRTRKEAEGGGGGRRRKEAEGGGRRRKEEEGSGRRRRWRRKKAEESGRRQKEAEGSREGRAEGREESQKTISHIPSRQFYLILLLAQNIQGPLASLKVSVCVKDREESRGGMKESKGEGRRGKKRGVGEARREGEGRMERKEGEERRKRREEGRGRKLKYPNLLTHPQ